MERVLKGTLCFKGERGDSAYEIAVNNGFKGTEEEWLETLSINISNVIDKDSTNTTVPSSKAVYDFINTIYPVGSIYMSISGTNPSVLFGGTWEQISGRFLIGAGSPEENTETAFGELNNSGYAFDVGGMGGQYKHVLTLEEMPNHRHGVANANENGADLSFTPVLLGDMTTGWEGSAFTSYEGGGQPHNNMPPYFTVYMWKRIG